MSRQPRGGRRPGSPDTRGEVLDAARHRFATEGYAGASVRAIAADAGVDPALVHHYFGTKRDLFREAAAFPVDADEVVARISARGREGAAEALAHAFFGVWEREDTRPRLLSVLRSAMTHDDAAALLRTFVGEELLGPVASALGVHDPLRVSLAASQMVGVAMLRYVVQVEPLANAEVDAIIDHVTPALHLHLFG